MDSEMKRKIEFDGMKNTLLNTITVGMTNGDVIKALFPNYSTDLLGINDVSLIDKETS